MDSFGWHWWGLVFFYEKAPKKRPERGRDSFAVPKLLLGAVTVLALLVVPCRDRAVVRKRYGDRDREPKKKLKWHIGGGRSGDVARERA